MILSRIIRLIIKNMSEEIKKEEEVVKEVKMRQIIIETDGDKINLVKAEVIGKIELIAILQQIIAYINQPTNK